MSEQPSDAEVMSGSFINSTIGDATPTPDVVEQQPAHQAQEPTPVYLGSRKFNSQGELEAYLSELEGRVANTNTVQTQVAPTPAPQVQPEEDISTLMFENPAKYAEIIQNRAYKKVMQDIERKEAQDKEWKDFYKANPDLEEFRDAVDFQLNKNWQTIKSQPLAQAKEILAKETRTYLNKLRGKPTGQGTELPSKPTVTVAGSAGGPAKKPVDQAPAVMSFTDQVRKMQRKG
jgi:hypothetical protein